MKQQISIQELIYAASREIKMRQSVYAGRVRSGKMTQQEADHEIDCMKAIHTVLLDRQVAERGSVFTPDYGTGAIEEYTLRLTPAYQQELSRRYAIDDMNIRLCYVDGVLDAMFNLRSVSRTTPHDEVNVKAMALQKDIDRLAPLQTAYIYAPMSTQRVHQRIAAFCEAYRAKFGEAYKVSPREAAKWNQAEYKNVPADRDLIAFYMSCNTYPLDTPKTLADYLSKYQQARQLHAREQAPAFPDTYDRKFMTDLATDPERYNAYRAHLKSLGYRVERNPGGELWTKITEA